MAEKVGADAKAAFFLLLILAGTASILDVGIIGWIVGPICILLGWFAILRAPLRATMLTLMFFALTLENPAEIPAAGQWQSPFYTLGAVMLTHLKKVIGGPWFFGCMDLMLLAAGVKWYLGSRRRTGIATPKPMIRLAQYCYAAIVFTFIIGKINSGGDNSMAIWQIDRVMYLPAVFLLCQAAFTGPNDYIAVGKVAFVAAILRSLQAMYVRAVVPEVIDPVYNESSLPYTTTHHDSILFATGTAIIIAMLINRVGKRALWPTLLGSPILIGGMIANDRRLVWIDIALVLIAIYFITEQNAFKRRLQRVVMIMVPIVAGYIAVGWGAKGGIFKPVQIIRSAVDSSSDGSTAWRDLENFNLIYTIKTKPIVGIGYGHGFWEAWPLPEVNYELERFIPHNSILGLWCYGGLIGYTGITLLWVGGIYFAIRAYYRSKVPLEKAAALVAMGVVIVYYSQCFGDLGLGAWTCVFLVSPALAVACKLAVKNGGWITPAVTRAQAPAATAAGPRA
ncbi:MAG TPA: hypothetical protein VHP33_11515 [Polyangiaceae bacterium]|nr:hypothetical protein [Polyangiaceae bacterium]